MNLFVRIFRTLVWETLIVLIKHITGKKQPCFTSDETVFKKSAWFKNLAILSRYSVLRLTYFNPSSVH